MSNRAALNVYLCGSIRKGDSDHRSDDYFWSPADELIVRSVMGEDAMLLNPAYSPISRSDPKVNFGCDVFLVSSSDAVLVDLRQSKGIGVGAEMMLAAQLGIPLVGWLPSTSPYRRSIVGNLFGEDLKDWVHPFAAALCDEWHDTLELVSRRAKDRALRYRPYATPPEFLNDAIDRFKRQYPEFVARVLRDR